MAKTLQLPRSARYRRKIGAFGRMDVKHDQSVLAVSTAAECYNFDMNSGALREGYGVIAHPFVPQTARRYFIYRFADDDGGYTEQYLYQLASGKIRYYDSATGEDSVFTLIEYPPVDMLNYRLNSKDVLLISCSGQKLKVWDGQRLAECNGPTVSSMALHYERLFVTSKDEPTKVYFSDDLDPTSWDISADGGGFIELLDERGALNKVVSFGGYLYIFRDHGISRVTAYGDQREFSVLNLYATAGRIYEQSIAVCGNCIMFLASDGLYVFDGYQTTRVLSELEGLITPSDGLAASFFNGRYFLACSMNFGGGQVGCETVEHGNNGLLSVDPKNGEYTVTRGVDISFMTAVTFAGSDFLMCCDGGRGGAVSRCGMRFEQKLPMRWRSPMTDLGSPERLKSLRELHIVSDSPCEVEIASEKRVKRMSVKAGMARKRINLACKRLSVTVDCAGGPCNIASPTVIYT